MVSAPGFPGSGYCAHPAADALGNTLTTYYQTHSLNDTFYDELSVNEWVAVDRIDAGTRLTKKMAQASSDR